MQTTPAESAPPDLQERDAPQDAGRPADWNRIKLLDVLRGFAIFGIFIMNMPWFGNSAFIDADGSRTWSQPHDVWAEQVRDLLFSGKFNAILSLLFGLGFCLQLEQLEAKYERAATRLYVRRLLILFTMGILHFIFIWHGDILYVYALLGFLLLLLRQARTKTIVGLVVVFTILGPAYHALMVHMRSIGIVDPTPRTALYEIWEASNNQVFSSGSYYQTVIERASFFLSLYLDEKEVMGAIVGQFPFIAATMLLGMLVFRFQLITRLGELEDALPKWQRWSFIVGLVTGAGFVAIFASDRTFEPTYLKAFGSALYNVCRLSLMTFYLVTLTRWLNSSWGAAAKDSLSVVGRMALSNYLLQSLIGTTLFSGWGIGLWGKLGPLACLVLSIMIFLLIQVPLSRFWMSKFSHGPVEWLWRYAIYRTPPRGSN